MPDNTENSWDASTQYMDKIKQKVEQWQQKLQQEINKDLQNLKDTTIQIKHEGEQIVSELTSSDTLVRQQVSDVKEDQQELRKDFMKMYLTLSDKIKTLKEEKTRPEGNPTPPSNQMP